MLVRELIEQLSEMPPELPVWVSDGVVGEFEVHATKRSGQLDPNKCLVVIDPHDLFEWAREFAIQALEDAQ